MTQEARKQKDAVVEELSRISGVEGVAFSQFVLNSGDTYMSWGRGEGDKSINFACFPVDYRYLDVMGIRITDGRNFKPSDNGVYIFNEAARKKYPWMAVDMPSTPGDWNVVGFCENIKFSTFRNNDST